MATKNKKLQSTINTQEETITNLKDDLFCIKQYITKNGNKRGENILQDFENNSITWNSIESNVIFNKLKTLTQNRSD